MEGIHPDKRGKAVDIMRNPWSFAGRLISTGSDILGPFYQDSMVDPHIPVGANAPGGKTTFRTVTCPSTRPTISTTPHMAVDVTALL